MQFFRLADLVLILLSLIQWCYKLHLSQSNLEALQRCLWALVMLHLPVRLGGDGIFLFWLRESLACVFLIFTENSKAFAIRLGIHQRVYRLIGSERILLRILLRHWNASYLAFHYLVERFCSIVNDGVEIL